MQVLKRVGVGSAAKISGILTAIVGLIVGVLFAFAAMFNPAPGGFWGWWPIHLVAWPIVYGLLGVIFGALYAALYNVVAGWVGGIRVELE